MLRCPQSWHEKDWTKPVTKPASLKEEKKKEINHIFIINILKITCQLRDASEDDLANQSVPEWSQDS